MPAMKVILKPSDNLAIATSPQPRIFASSTTVVSSQDVRPVPIIQVQVYSSRRRPVTMAMKSY